MTEAARLYGQRADLILCDTQEAALRGPMPCSSAQSGNSSGHRISTCFARP